jgi:hypothetical protein
MTAEGFPDEPADFFSETAHKNEYIPKKHKY